MYEVIFFHYQYLRELFIAKMERFLHSLEDCLTCQIGSKLFEKFCKEQFCGELILFYKEYIKYRNALNQVQRNKIGSNNIIIIIKYHGTPVLIQV